MLQEFVWYVILSCGLVLLLLSSSSFAGGDARLLGKDISIWYTNTPCGAIHVRVCCLLLVSVFQSWKAMRQNPSTLFWVAD